MKESHVYVRREYIDLTEGRISETCHRTAAMQKFPYFVPAFSHHLKPLPRGGFQFTCMLFDPRIDGGIPRGNAAESQQLFSSSLQIKIGDHKHAELPQICPWDVVRKVSTRQIVLHFQSVDLSIASNSTFLGFNCCHVPIRIGRSIRCHDRAAYATEVASARNPEWCGRYLRRIVIAVRCTR